MWIFSLFVVGIWIAAVWGWIWNIVKLVPMLMDTGPLVVSGMLVGRVIGIFLAPLGSVLGYF